MKSSFVCLTLLLIFEERGAELSVPRLVDILTQSYCDGLARWCQSAQLAAHELIMTVRLVSELFS